MAISAKKISEGYPDRIRLAETAIESSLPEMADRAGISTPTIYRWLNGERKPKPDTLATLATANGIEPRWLLTGEGEMLAASGDGAKIDAAVMARTSETPAFATPAQLRKLGLVRIPALTIEAGAGPPYEVTVEAVDEDDSGMIVSEQQARSGFGVPAERLHTIRARGDSMIPTIFPGDEVFVARVDAGSLLVDGAVYAISSPDGVLIKRLRFSVDYTDEQRPKRWVHIVSDNPDVENYKVPAEVFERDYRVVAAFLKVNRSL